MFTSTYKAAAFGALVILSGCNAAQLNFQGGASAPHSMTFKNGLRVKAPANYCIDRKTTKTNRHENAVAIFSCHRLRDPMETDTTQGHMFTVTSTDGRIVNFKQFRNYLKSPAGLAMLSQGNDPSSITITRTRITNSAIYVELTDTTSPDHLGHVTWRSFANIGPHLAIVSLYQGAGDPIRGKDGERVLKSFNAGILNAN